MSNRIVFQNDNGGVSIIIPAEDALAKYGIDAIAIKDVPSGRPYKIVDASEIPTDRSLRDAFVVDVADMTDGIGGKSNKFDEAK